MGRVQHIHAWEIEMEKWYTYHDEKQLKPWELCHGHFGQDFAVRTEMGRRNGGKKWAAEEKNDRVKKNIDKKDRRKLWPFFDKYSHLYGLNWQIGFGRKPGKGAKGGKNNWRLCSL